MRPVSLGYIASYHPCQAVIQSHFDYCSSVWGTRGLILQDKQQKLHNGAARALTFSSYDADAGQLLEILGWKNLDRQRNIPSWYSNAYMG